MALCRSPRVASAGLATRSDVGVFLIVRKFESFCFVNMVIFFLPIILDRIFACLLPIDPKPQINADLFILIDLLPYDTQTIAPHQSKNRHQWDILLSVFFLIFACVIKSVMS